MKSYSDLRLVSTLHSPRRMKRSLPFLLIFFLSCSPVIPLDNPFEGDIPEPQPLASASSAPPLRILAMDVGQGDSTLVIGPLGKTMLIDAGPVLSGISLDIAHLNWILSTHYDADHIGGLGEIIKGPDQTSGTGDDLFPLNGFFDRGDFTDKETPAYDEYRELTTSERHTVTPGLAFDLGGGAKARAIVVNGHYEDGRSIHLNPDEENEASIGLLITHGDFRYFTAGDLTGGGTSREETKDLETSAGEIIGDIDVLHLSHHGSRASTHESFLNLVTPEAAIISAGKENDYGHPHPEVLERLKNAGTTIYRTDHLGNLEITVYDNHYEIAPR